MNNRLTNIIAAVLLVIMFITAFFSIKDDSTTMDELAHIPAGYSYLTQKDFRLNPEHPPLIKDLAAIPLLLLNLNFPQNHISWTQEVNSQWWFGNQFLYQSGNNPDQILSWARFPMILLLIFLGWFLFFWTKELAGNKAALLALCLFSFSPTFLAHGCLVTTDVGAALGVVLATYFWLKFLKNPIKKNIIFAGIVFGIAMLLKFSLALLIPFFAIISLIFAWLKSDSQRMKNIFKYIKLSLVAAVIGVFIIWPVYQFHILNYPATRQLSDTKFILESNPIGPLKNLCVYTADKPLLRPLSYYLLGLLMATQRAAFGNTVYFMGMVSATGWWYYFPVVYFLKIPLAFHILTLIALLTATYAVKKPFWKDTWKRLKNWVMIHFAEFSMFVFLTIYWFTSMLGNLNIGIRHILPTFPFIYILVSIGTINWLKKTKKLPRLKIMSRVFVSFLLVWYISSSLAVFPHYLSYFNEVAHGPKNGYKYVVDSNYDWGQDLKRLKKWVEKKGIDKIYVDYFGGGDTNYYLKEKYVSWQGDRNKKELPKGSYLAVSATMLQNGRGFAAPGHTQPVNYYRWLDEYKPIARIGNSIFVYYIP